MIFIPLAHGALGWYDELIFLGVAVIFLVMMGVSWFQTRMTEYDDDQSPQAQPIPPVAIEPETRDDHFPLQ